MMECRTTENHPQPKKTEIFKAKNRTAPNGGESPAPTGCCCCCMKDCFAGDSTTSFSGPLFFALPGGRKILGRRLASPQGPVVRSMVSANHRYLTLVSANQASSNSALGFTRVYKGLQGFVRVYKGLQGFISV